MNMLKNEEIEGNKMGDRGKIPKLKLPISKIVKEDMPMSVTARPSMPSKALKSDMEQREARWRAEEDIRTIQRAEEIKADKDRMKAAKIVAQEQMDKLKKI